MADVKKLIGHKLKPYKMFYTEKDACLYSLSIGFSKKAMKTDEFKYTYEMADDFTCFPTNAVTLAHGGEILKGFHAGKFDLPGMPEFDPMMLLHGEETITIEKPILPNTKYVV